MPSLANVKWREPGESDQPYRHISLEPRHTKIWINIICQIDNIKRGCRVKPEKYNVPTWKTKPQYQHVLPINDFRSIGKNNFKKSIQRQTNTYRRRTGITCYILL